MSLGLGLCETPAVSEEPSTRVPTWHRLLGSWWLLAVVVLAVYLASPVRNATEHDPAFTPLTADSLVHGRGVALDSFGAKRLIGHPVVLTDEALDPGFVVTAVGADGWSELRAAVDDPDVDVRDYFPWPAAVLAVPGVVVTDAVAALAGGDDSHELIAEHRFSFVHTASASIVVLGAALALRAAALVVLGGSPDRRRLLANATALVFAFGTSAYSTAGRALWQHTPSLLLLSLAMWCAVRVQPAFCVSLTSHSDVGDTQNAEGRVDPWVVGLAAALTGAAIVRPTNLGVALVLLAWVLVRRRGQWVPTLASVLVGGVVVSGAFVLVSQALLGRWLPEYYSAGRLRFGEWIPEAVAANVVSPSRGLLIASPFLLLAIPGTWIVWRHRERDHRALVVALWAGIAVVTASVSAFPQWWAGHSFGPRFMTETVPLMFVLALPAWDAVFAADRLRAGAPRRSRSVAAVVAVTVLAVWSIGFHASGSVAGVTGCWNLYPDDIDSDPSRVWSVTDSQVLEPLHRVLDADRRAAQDEACIRTR